MLLTCSFLVFVLFCSVLGVCVYVCVFLVTKPFEQKAGWSPYLIMCRKKLSLLEIFHDPRVSSVEPMNWLLATSYLNGNSSSGMLFSGAKIALCDFFTIPPDNA